jgi:P-type Cu2+ transporter
MNAPVHIDYPGAAAVACLAETRLNVPDIRCAGCISKIERTMMALPGVLDARVHFGLKRLTVRHEDRTTVRSIIDTLADLGFEAQPVADIASGAESAEETGLARALAVAGFGAMNIMLLSVGIWSGAGESTRELFHWLSAAIGIPVVAYSGQPFFRSALKVLRRGRTNMDVPISIGVLLVTAMSLYETMIGGAHAYFDGAVMLLFFLLAGRTLDSMMRNRARSGISALLSRTGPGATILAPDGSTSWRKTEEIASGMIMLVAAGEAFAADGVVIEGSSLVDRSLLTGESRAEPLVLGGDVQAGALNLAGPIRVKVTAAGEGTLVAELARLMETAGQGRSRYVRIADRASRLYAPAVHTLAALAFVGWLFAGAGVHQSLTIAAAVLIITCPCALGLAVPVAHVVAAGALMKRGIMVKDGSALERMAQIDRVLFDKTGTLTQGEPRPTTIDSLAAGDAAIACALSRASRHPLSRGLTRALVARGVGAAAVQDIGEIPGEGMTGKLDGIRVSLGRPEEAGEGLASALRIGDRIIILHFADSLRPDAAKAVWALAALGLPASIVSGDRTEAVCSVGATLGLPVAASEARPQDKLALIEQVQQAGARVLMVGDGLNDGPALAAAHASMAPGTASDVGRQAADMVFTGDGLSAVPIAISVSRRTMQVVRQNFMLAIGYNVLAVPLALAGLVTPLIAALAMSGSSILVVGNALRLARVKDI